jgi:hypothetical protein
MDDAPDQLGLWPQGERTTGKIEAVKIPKFFDLLRLEIAIKGGKPNRAFLTNYSP